MSGLSWPVALARSNNSVPSVRICSAMAICSAVGSNVPASRTVSPWVFAATMRRRNPVNASHGSPPELRARWTSAR